jgi:hypothetical protein
MSPGLGGSLQDSYIHTLFFVGDDGERLECMTLIRGVSSRPLYYFVHGCAS